MQTKGVKDKKKSLSLSVQTFSLLRPYIHSTSFESSVLNSLCFTLLTYENRSMTSHFKNAKCPSNNFGNFKRKLVYLNRHNPCEKQYKKFTSFHVIYRLAVISNGRDL